jgi:hypothetical protein
MNVGAGIIVGGIEIAFAWSETEIEEVSVLFDDSCAEAELLGCRTAAITLLLLGRGIQGDPTDGDAIETSSQ